MDKISNLSDDCSKCVDELKNVLEELRYEGLKIKEVIVKNDTLKKENLYYRKRLEETLAELKSDIKLKRINDLENQVALLQATILRIKTFITNV